MYVLTHFTACQPKTARAGCLHHPVGAKTHLLFPCVLCRHLQHPHLGARSNASARSDAFLIELVDFLHLPEDGAHSLWVWARGGVTASCSLSFCWLAVFRLPWNSANSFSGWSPSFCWWNKLGFHLAHESARNPNVCQYNVQNGVGRPIPARGSLSLWLWATVRRLRGGIRREGRMAFVVWLVDLLLPSLLAHHLPGFRHCHWRLRRCLVGEPHRNKLGRSLLLGSGCDRRLPAPPFKRGHMCVWESRERTR